MRILVCGDRHWTDEKAIRRELGAMFTGSTVIHGACRGADAIAGKVARELGFAVEEYPADWDKYGRAAGPIRNRQMIKEGNPDLVIAFHPDLSKSKGTADMCSAAKQAGVPVIPVSS